MFLAALGTGFGQPAITTQPQNQTNAQGQRLPDRLFLPPNYDPATNYPLVLFWHGSGGLGTNNQGQLTDTTAQYVFLNATNMARHPCFCLAPQMAAPSGTYDPMTYWLVYADLAVALLGRLQSEVSIDPERLYVTGLSTGGMASWAMLARTPDLFAAAN
jgi:predicted peptidase